MIHMIVTPIPLCHVVILAHQRMHLTLTLSPLLLLTHSCYQTVKHCIFLLPVSVLTALFFRPVRISVIQQMSCPETNNSMMMPVHKCWIPCYYLISQFSKPSVTVR